MNPLGLLSQIHLARFGLIFALFLPLPVSAAPTTQIQMTISPWSADCSFSEQGEINCSLPTPSDSKKTLNFELATDLQPGSVSTSKNEWSLESNPSVKVRVTLFMVHPKLESGLPQYLQVKIEQFGTAPFICAQSVRWREPMELPPLICAGASSTKQFGVTAVSQFNN